MLKYFSEELLLNYPYAKNYVLREIKTATDGAETLTIKTKGYYQIILCAGGGGAAYGFNGYGLAAVSKGGNGGCYIGEVLLNAGTYSVTVGAGGAGRIPSNPSVYEAYTGATGGSSTFKSNATNTNLIITTGGVGGKVSVADTHNGSNGTINHSAATDTNVETQYSYQSKYGLGGDHNSSGVNKDNGTNGYFKITYLR